MRWTENRRNIDIGIIGEMDGGKRDDSLQLHTHKGSVNE